MLQNSLISEIEIQNEKLYTPSKAEVKWPGPNILFLLHVNYPFGKKEEATANNVLLVQYFKYENYYIVFSIKSDNAEVLQLYLAYIFTCYF